MDRTNVFTANRKLTEDCAEAYAKRILSTPTCTCTSSTFNALNALLAKCSYDTTGSFLVDYSYYDYDYESYVASGYDYSKTDKSTTHKTNMATKYQWLEWISSGRSGDRPIPGLGSFNNLFSGDSNSLSVIIIIIASSISLLSITVLSVLVVKKRKRVE